MGCNIEPLESRQLMSAAVLTSAELSIGQTSPILTVDYTVQYHLSGTGTLRVIGSDLPDVISIQRIGNKIVLNGNNPDSPLVTVSFTASRVKRITIETAQGDDRIGVDGTIGLRCSLDGGAGNDTIDGSAGDTLIGGSGNDKLVIPIVPPIFASGETIVPANFEGPAMLMGGAGNDTLVAGDADHVTGGSGHDTAKVLAYFTVVDPMSRRDQLSIRL